MFSLVFSLGDSAVVSWLMHSALPASGKNQNLRSWQSKAVRNVISKHLSLWCVPLVMQDIIWEAAQAYRPVPYVCVGGWRAFEHSSC